MREIDIVVVGATGYTGRLCAKYIATELPSTLRWAIAGRSRAKLQKLAENLSKAQALSEPAIIPVDISSQNDVDELATRCRVIISVVGPYGVAGSKIFRACARHGTGYVDCHGEVPWLKDMIIENEETAKASGAIMIPGCGTVGMPADVSAFLLSQHFNKAFGSKLFASETCVEKSLPESPSGGTVASVYHKISRNGLEGLEKDSKAFALSPVKPAYLTGEPQPGMPTETDVIRETESFLGRTSAFGIHHSPYFGTAIISPVDDVDRAGVTRAWGLLSKTEFAYSPNFHYGGTTQKCANVVQGWITRAVFKLILFGLASWLGGFLMRFAPQQGGGASEAENESEGLLEITAIGVGEKIDGVESRPMASCEWRFRRDPYTFTAIGLSQAAMVLLEDQTEAHRLGGGILCPSLLGEKYVARLQATGGKIEVKSL